MLFIRLFKGKLNKLYSGYVFWRKSMRLKRKATLIRRKIVMQKGYTVIDKPLRATIRNYCKSVFGSKAYWKWIAVYTELREEFKAGWIPYDYYKLKMIPSLNPPEVSSLSELKTMDYRLFKDYCIRPVLIIIDHLIYNHAYELITVNQAVKLLEEFNAEVVIKKDNSGCGQDVTFINSRDIAIGDLLGIGNYVIQPSVKQYAGISRYFRGSVNTVRIMTYLDLHYKVHVVGKYLRLGLGKSRVDNTSMGGVFIFLDSGGNTISKCFNGLGLDAGPRHPDSGYVYKDIKVPAMEQVIELCINAHYKYPYVGFVGWDVYIDESREPKLLEWNAGVVGFWLSEAHIGPMFNVNEIKSRLNE